MRISDAMLGGNVLIIASPSFDRKNGYLPEIIL
jgi:hypothetical protein